jgi:hypothetical protein
MVSAMMPMNDMWRWPNGSVFVLNGDALRTMVNSKHALDPAGYATDADDSCRNTAKHSAGDLRTPLESRTPCHSARHYLQMHSSALPSMRQQCSRKEFHTSCERFLMLLPGHLTGENGSTVA